MGILSWIRGGPREDKDTKWLREEIDDSIREHDGVALAETCAALAGSGTMAFGIVLPVSPTRDELRERAFGGMKLLLVDLPDDQCERVFDILTRAKLPIDIEPRRARLIEDREDAGVKARRLLIERISECPVEKLIEAAIMLQVGFEALGIEVPAAARAELAALAIARIEAWLPSLDDAAAEVAFDAILGGRLNIDIAARSEQLARRRRDRHELVIAKASDSEPRNEALERAIIEHPDDAHGFSVLSDSLHDQGHPRGELIALQLRAETEPELAPAVVELFAKHEDALLGPLAAYTRTRDLPERDAFMWRRGFIHHARLAYDSNRRDDVRLTPLAEVLAMLVTHPSGRFLAELDVGLNSDDTLEPIIATLARYRPAHLRRLLLGDFTQEDSEVSWYEIGNVAPLWTALPGLRYLVIHGGVFELGAIEHAGLERLEVATGGLTQVSARALAAARLPAVRHLDIWYGTPAYNGDATIDDVRPLLARTDLPQLVHLGLRNAAFTDDICAALACTPVVAQLRELDLSLGTMSDEGARALRPEAFPKLELLNVSCNYLSDAAIAALRSRFPKVVSTRQDDAETDPDERYPSLGE